MRQYYKDSHNMADITEISDDEFEEIPTRRPIGWNYQNINNSGLMEGKIKGKNPVVADNGKNNSKTIMRIPSSDDIEVLEIVDIKNSSKPKTLLPESSSRKEIITMTRYCNVQSSIKSFLNSDQGNDKVRHNKLSLNNPHKLKLENSKRNMSLQNGKILNLQNNSDEKNSVSDIHNNNSELNIISEYIDHPVNKSENDTKENLANSTKPECSLMQIKLSSEKEKESTVFKPETSNKEVNETAILQADTCQNYAAIPGTSTTTEEVDNDITSEYSKSLFEEFINKWKCLEGFGGGDFLIHDRLLNYYALCHPTYKHSRKFCNGLKKAISEINTENQYVLIKDIRDTMKRYKDSPYIEKEEDPNEWFRKTLKLSVEGDNAEPDLSAADLRKQHKLKLLEDKMIKIHSDIQALETKEVDFDDAENSSYLVVDRLKAFFMKLDNKYCKLAKCSEATGRPIEKKFKYEGSRFSEINNRISSWVNKHREFPEYMDVLNLVKQVAKTNYLQLGHEAVRAQAQEIFRDVGKILKDRRQKDDLYSIYAYAGDDLKVDPADTDKDLYKRLKNNEKEAKEKLDKVFTHFCEKELEEREKLDIRKKKEKKDEEVKKSEKSEIKLQKETESNINKAKSEESETNDNDEIETISESDSVIKDGEESAERDSDSEGDLNIDNHLDNIDDPQENTDDLQDNIDDPQENGMLTNTSDNTDMECVSHKLNVVNDSLAGPSKSVSLDISDTSDDEEVIVTANNDTINRKMEMHGSVLDEINEKPSDSDLSDTASECSSEDILIADIPDPLEYKSENITASLTGTSYAELSHLKKRKLDFPCSSPKRSHINSSPEIVELD